MLVAIFVIGSPTAIVALHGGNPFETAGDSAVLDIFIRELEGLQSHDDFCTIIHIWVPSVEELERPTPC